MPDASHRASDAEREAVAERLRTAAAEGRLDADELDERLGRAYGARTVGELAPLTLDLPADAPALPPVPAEPRYPGLRTEHARRRFATFITVNVTCIVVWIATGAEDPFWPGWVLIGTGIAAFSTLVAALLGVADEDQDEDDDDRRGRRRARDDRRLRR